MPMFEVKFNEADIKDMIAARAKHVLSERVTDEIMDNDEFWTVFEEELDRFVSSDHIRSLIRRALEESEDEIIERMKERIIEW